ncbi:MAG: putative 2OG-Fe(II) oxygenase, partial [Methylophagaceae bacterium]
QSGDLVLFPSWVYHYTTPNQSGKRCVISFDTQIKG